MNKNELEKYIKETIELPSKERMTYMGVCVDELSNDCLVRIIHSLKDDLEDARRREISDFNDYCKLSTKYHIASMS